MPWVKVVDKDGQVLHRYKVGKFTGKHVRKPAKKAAKEAARQVAKEAKGSKAKAMEAKVSKATYKAFNSGEIETCPKEEYYYTVAHPGVGRAGGRRGERTGMNVYFTGGPGKKLCEGERGGKWRTCAEGYISRGLYGRV